MKSNGNFSTNIYDLVLITFCDFQGGKMRNLLLLAKYFRENSIQCDLSELFRKRGMGKFL